VHKTQYNKTGYLIRHVASPGELETALNILGAQFDPLYTHENYNFEDLANELPDDRQLMLVAEHEGQVIGRALGFCSTLRIIAIVPEHRGKGLGGRLF
jgi:predicted N-acetyltransferase YhbS